MKRISWGVVLLVLAANASVAADSPYRRILLPLYAADPMPGAYGSLWKSQFVFHNGSTSRAYIVASCWGVCQTDLAADEELLPGETQTGLPKRYPVPANPVAGTVLYMHSESLPLDDMEPVAFQLRVTDLSRTATGAGTEVPVVREKDFRTSTIHLLNIPTDMRFRLAARLLEMNLARADFSVRIVDQAANVVLRSLEVTTQNPDVEHRTSFAPGFVGIDDLLSGLPAPPDYIRVEIEPLTAGAAFWAYVSITNNDSQQFTLVTAQ